MRHRRPDLRQNGDDTDNQQRQIPDHTLASTTIYKVRHRTRPVSALSTLRAGRRHLQSTIAARDRLDSDQLAGGIRQATRNLLARSRRTERPPFALTICLIEIKVRAAS